ncbi:MAG: DegT/DnrJ/EryC1/StrS family aminotransferase [Desulfomonilaceae bacterium]
MQQIAFDAEKDDGLAVPLLDLGPIHRSIGAELRNAVLGVLESNRFIGGPEVESFEREISAYFGSHYAIGVSSGTDAIIASLMALDIGFGDRVIVPSFTFFATAGSVRRLGAEIVFCDIEPRTFNLDPAKLDKLITSRTRAVIPVHLFGLCADMDPIMQICRRHGLKVVEDAAQAIGATYQGKMAGVMGDTGCLSFFPSKNLGGIGDGGLILTQDKEVAEKLRRLREHGAQHRYYHSLVGGNFRLDAIQAAALRVKLSHLEEWHQQRRDNAGAYIDAFSDLERKGLIRLPTEVPSHRHVFNQFVIRVSRRDGLKGYLKSRLIDTAIYYPVPLHLQDCFADLGYREGSLPESEKAAREVLALPIFPGLTTPQRDKVIYHVREFLLN